jgi:hypothetical protein
MSHLAIWGNAYIAKYREAGEITQIGLIAPDRIRPELEHGQLRFRYSPPTGAQQLLTEADIVHVRGLSVDGLSAVRRRVELPEAVDEARLGCSGGERVLTCPIGAGSDDLGARRLRSGTLRLGLRVRPPLGVFAASPEQREDQEWEEGPLDDSTLARRAGTCASSAIQRGIESAPTVHGQARGR